MRKLMIPILITALILTATFSLFQMAKGQSQVGPGSLQIVKSEREGENLREIYAPAGQDQAEAPEIGFIDSPTATCYQPDATRDECYMNWYYAYVDANPQYIISMTVAINAIGIVGNHRGFFQTNMYVPYNMIGPGYKVACGSPGAGGNPSLGNAYAWTIRARDSNGLKSANYGTAYCPAYTP